MFSHAWVGMINDGYQDTNGNTVFYWINAGSNGINNAITGALGFKIGGAAQWTTWTASNSSGSVVQTVNSTTNFLRYKGNMTTVCRTSKLVFTKINCKNYNFADIRVRFRTGNKCYCKLLSNFSFVLVSMKLASR